MQICGDLPAAIYTCYTILGVSGTYSDLCPIDHIHNCIIIYYIVSFW